MGNPAKLFIGYRTRLVEGYEKFMPTFSAPSNWTDPEKIAKDVAAKEEAFRRQAHLFPYTGTFDLVVVANPAQEQIGRYSYKDRQPGSGRASVAEAVRAYLKTAFPKAWQHDPTAGKKTPEVVIIGFDPRAFLKMLGLECSMPAVNKALPLAAWYSNSDHRDIGDAVLPSDYAKVLSLADVVRARRPPGEEDGKKWDDLTAKWQAPGADPEADVRIAIELAAQLGLMRE